jgi:hypothetical protein
VTDKKVQKLVHHLIKETICCIYCSEDAQQEWGSEWNKYLHYKTFTCKTCGKKNFLNPGFAGSGHDSFGELEKKISKI